MASRTSPRRCCCRDTARPATASPARDKGPVCAGKQGHAIGSLQRIPPKRHSWPIDRPQSEIVGQNEWASGDTKEVTGWAVGLVVVQKR